MTTPHSPVCIVTGASRGIGQATARRFAIGGYRLGICARNAEAIAAVKAELTDLGAETIAASVNIEESRAVERFVEEVRQSFGRLDVVVNNAGASFMKSVEETTDDDFHRQMGANCAGPFYFARAAWPHLKEHGGALINISSMAATDPFPGFSVYGATKAWVNNFSHSLANEGRPHNIRVFTVAPGAIETAMLRGVLPDFPAEEALPPQDVASVIWSLTEEQFRPASGSVFVVRK